MLGLSDVETKRLNELQLEYNRRISKAIQNPCDCRNIGKNGMACDDTLYFCDKCRDKE